tara:strand:+ start:1024 stop:1503 length:480 start_codon:yes stop_codon:yes gene_type:complete
MAQRQLPGNGFQQMSQILQFHEKRLNKLDTAMGGVIDTVGGGGGSDEVGERVSSVEDSMGVVMASLEASAQNVVKIGSVVDAAHSASEKALGDTKKLETTVRNFPTKLAVVTEQFRLLTSKVEGLLSKVTALEEKMEKNVTLSVSETTNDGDEDSGDSD